MQTFSRRLTYFQGRWSVPGQAIFNDRVQSLEIVHNSKGYHYEGFAGHWSAPEDAQALAEDMLSGRVEAVYTFVRSWDCSAVTTIYLIPFAMSSLFAVVWIGVSVIRYGGDVQVAAQTAFTAASYIVTGGTLADNM